MGGVEQEKKCNLETSWGLFVKLDVIQLKGCCDAKDTSVANENCQICFVSCCLFSQAVHITSLNLTLLARQS